MALFSAHITKSLARKASALTIATSLMLATSGCAIFDDGAPAPQRDSEAGGAEVMSQSSGNNQALWIALLAFLAAGIAAGAAASSSE
ncbi:MAG: hypothetical protein ACPG06_05390 [Alphaproteobacteria bacterium]